MRGSIVCTKTMNPQKCMQDWGYNKYKDKLKGNQMLQDFNNEKNEHKTGAYKIEALLYWNPANSH
jgi:hypothetical protein